MRWSRSMITKTRLSISPNFTILVGNRPITWRPARRPVLIRFRVIHGKALEVVPGKCHCELGIVANQAFVLETLAEYIKPFYEIGATLAHKGKFERTWHNGRNFCRKEAAGTATKCHFPLASRRVLLSKKNQKIREGLSHQKNRRSMIDRK